MCESNAVFNYFSWLKQELSSAHVKFDVWTGPNTDLSVKDYNYTSKFWT